MWLEICWLASVAKKPCLEALGPGQHSIQTRILQMFCAVFSQLRPWGPCISCTVMLPAPTPDWGVWVRSLTPLLFASGACSCAGQADFFVPGSVVSVCHGVCEYILTSKPKSCVIITHTAVQLMDYSFLTAMPMLCVCDERAHCLRSVLSTFAGQLGAELCER